jgi:3-hydroxybutyrate dehydrogenase
MPDSPLFDLQEPNIQREEILVVNDAYFHPGNVAIVTGSASGIGRATTIALAANGITVVATDIDAAGGAQTVELAAALGGTARFVPADLTIDGDIEACVRQAAEWGNIKYLANIAGMQHIAPIESFPMETYDRMLRVMLRAPFYLSRLCIPHIRNSQDGTGAIGNMCSVHGHIVTRHKPVYNIAKFALRGLTQSIAAEGEGKIRSFSVSTGFVKTPLALKQVPEQARQRGISPAEVVREVMLARSQIKELMTPIEVANLFVVGFSSLGKYLIGGDLLFDGGMSETY